MEKVLELVLAIAIAVGLISSVVVLLLRGTRWDVVGRRHLAAPVPRGVWADGADVPDPVELAALRAARERPPVDPGWREDSPVARFVAHQPAVRTPARPSSAVSPVFVSTPVGCYSGARSRGYGAVGSASRSQ